MLGVAAPVRSPRSRPPVPRGKLSELKERVANAKTLIEVYKATSEVHGVAKQAVTAIKGNQVRWPPRLRLRRPPRPARPDQRTSHGCLLLISRAGLVCASCQLLSDFGLLHAGARAGQPFSVHVRGRSQRSRHKPPRRTWQAPGGMPPTAP